MSLLNEGTFTGTAAVASNPLPDFLYIQCPQCKDYVQIERSQINCGIFRHAVYNETGQIVNPHMSEVECAILKADGKAYGCCKPFQIIVKYSDTFDPIYCISKCDYV